MVIWIAIALAAVGVTVFVLPHHVGTTSESKRQSLCSNLLELIYEARNHAPSSYLTGGALMLGCLTPLAPMPLYLLAQYADKDRPVVLIVGGVLLLACTVATFLIVLLSELSYSLGSPSKASGRGVNTVLAWLFPALCSIAAFVFAAF